jgi:hypothetical protein
MMACMMVLQMVCSELLLLRDYRFLEDTKAGRRSPPGDGTSSLVCACVAEGEQCIIRQDLR